MNSIGSLIQHFRNEKGLSREKLAQDICTEKYVYLVEKGQRTPSTEIVHLFGEKLDVDFFDFYEYLDCEDPETVREYVKKFNLLRRDSNFAAIKPLNDVARKLPDFQKLPWLYEIALNNIIDLMYNQQGYQEAIVCIQKQLTNIDKKYSESIYVVYFYTLLSHCSQMIGDLVASQEAITQAEAILEKKKNIEKYQETNINLQISKLALYYGMEKFEEAIQIGEDLYQYQKLVNKYERIHYTFFYLAFTYHRLGVAEKTGIYFLKGIAMLIIDFRPMDAYIIGMQEAFVELSENMNLKHDCVDEFRKIYPLEASNRAQQ